MIRYQLPSDLTRDQFHGLVTDIYYRLTKHGLDPVFNMIIGDRDELAEDGTARGVFTVFVSEDAALILAQCSPLQCQRFKIASPDVFFANEPLA